MKGTQLLHNLGQSIWLDNITRDLLDSGTLKRYIDDLSVTGLTSNPAIFDHTFKTSSAYDREIVEGLKRGKSEEIVLGRGKDGRKVHEWLTTAASVPGFIGVAVGRTTFWEPLVAWRAKTMSREQAVTDIVRRCRESVDIFEGRA